MFGFVARKQGSTTDNVSHLFTELDPQQPASAIVNFVSKLISSQKQWGQLRWGEVRWGQSIQPGPRPSAQRPLLSPFVFKAQMCLSLHFNVFSCFACAFECVHVHTCVCVCVWLAWLSFSSRVDSRMYGRKCRKGRSRVTVGGRRVASPWKGSL